MMLCKNRSAGTCGAVPGNRPEKNPPLVFCGAGGASLLGSASSVWPALSGTATLSACAAVGSGGGGGSFGSPASPPA